MYLRNYTSFHDLTYPWMTSVDAVEQQRGLNNTDTQKDVKLGCGSYYARTFPQLLSPTTTSFRRIEFVISEDIPLDSACFVSSPASQLELERRR